MELTTMEMKKDLQAKILRYAMLNLEKLQSDNNITFCRQENELYIILNSGHSLRLSDAEIKHHASEYLRSEIETINTIY